jgi:hypothetical protein
MKLKYTPEIIFTVEAVNLGKDSKYLLHDVFTQFLTYVQDYKFCDNSINTKITIGIEPQIFID